MVSAVTNERNVEAISMHAAHSAMVAIDIARPRMRVGNSSAMITQTVGPMPSENAAT